MNLTPSDIVIFVDFTTRKLELHIRDNEGVEVCIRFPVVGAYKLVETIQQGLFQLGLHEAGEHAQQLPAPPASKDGN